MRAARWAVEVPGARLAGHFVMPEGKPTEIAVQHRSIVLVEDDDALRETLRLDLEAHGYRVRDYSSGEAALDDATSTPLLALLDYRLPCMNGLDLLGELRQRFPQLPAIVISSDCSESLIPNGPGLPEAQLVRKPFANSVLLAAIARLTI